MKHLATRFSRLFPIGLLAAAIFATGCQHVRTYNSKNDTTYGKKKAVENIYQGRELPEHLRRIAVLPIHKGEYEHVDLAGIEASFTQELIKRNLFEVVPVPEQRMREYFGERSFSSVEFLPTKLLSKLHEAYAIDGVMLIDISYFRAYQPVALGVRIKLLDGRTGEFAWATDELFDGSNPAVSNAARKYFKTESRTDYPLQETLTVLHSPLRFSQYVANAVFGTIQ